MKAKTTKTFFTVTLFALGTANGALAVNPDYLNASELFEHALSDPSQISGTVCTSHWIPLAIINKTDTKLQNGDYHVQFCEPKFEPVTGNAGFAALSPPMWHAIKLKEGRRKKGPFCLKALDWEDGCFDTRHVLSEDFKQWSTTASVLVRRKITATITRICAVTHADTLICHDTLNDDQAPTSFVTFRRKP